jgi:hypothetical protein
MSVGSRARVLFPLTLIVGVLSGSGSGGAELPDPPARDGRARAADEEAIEQQPVCIASTVRSAGELGPALLYLRSRLPDGRLVVGYYAFFSDERPWGNNWLTWSVLPALGVDLVYTRLFLIAPGIRYARYGRGDVEGFRVIYGESEGGRLRAERAIADDDRHRRAELGPEDLFALDPARITLSTDSWSHHLGARVSRASRLAYRRCYGPGTIRPLTPEVARRFDLAHRALPAAVGPVSAE